MAIRALGEGAVAIVTKSKLGVRDSLNESALLLVDAVRGAAAARLSRAKRGAKLFSPSPGPERPLQFASDKLVAVGASTGELRQSRTSSKPCPRKRRPW